MVKEGGYKLVWKFLKESKFYFLIISLIFIFAFLVGYVFPIFFVDFIKKFIEEIAKKTENMGFWQLLVFILENNLKTAFIGLIFGMAVSVLPLILAVFNGYVLGFVSNKAVAVSGASVLLKLLPHGIFELPALILSLGLGLRLGMFIFKKKGKRKKEFMYSLKNSLRVFLYVILPLLVIAAIIETALMVLLK